MDETRSSGRPLRRLLFAVDDSAASRAALPAVAGLAFGGETEVTVLHVDDRGKPDEGRGLVADAACRLVVLAVNARSKFRQAPHERVAAEIGAAAAELDADLVVLGSRGRCDLGGLPLGSVSQEVLERTPCPLLVVRAGRRAGGRRRRILVPVAGDEDLTRLVRTTAAIAELDAQVLVLHLMTPAAGELQLAISTRVVHQMVAGLRRCGVRARGSVRAGAHRSAQEIARTALGYGADLVVMGSPRLPSLAALLRGGAPRVVVPHGDGPVLVRSLDGSEDGRP